MGIVLMLYGLAAQKSAYVQCFPAYFRIQTPFYPLVVSYARVRGTYPVQMGRVFDPEQDRTAQRSWPSRYWTMTAVAVELKRFPMSEWWLRLWLDPHLFAPNSKGFIFLVEDWMGLSRELDEFLAMYRERRAARKSGR